MWKMLKRFGIVQDCSCGPDNPKLGIEVNGTVVPIGGGGGGGSGSTRDLLWENPTPDYCFEEQNIPLPDMTQYEGVEIIYSRASGYDWLDNIDTGLTKVGMYSTGFVPIKSGDNAIMLEQHTIQNEGLSSNYDMVYRRCVTVVVGDTSYAAVEASSYGNNYGNPGTELALCVPIYVYGIKSGQASGGASGGATKPVLFAVEGETVHYYGDPERIPTIQEIVDAFMQGNAYVVLGEYARVSKVINIDGDNANGVVIYYCNGARIEYAWMMDTDREECEAAMTKWLA